MGPPFPWSVSSQCGMEGWRGGWYMGPRGCSGAGTDPKPSAGKKPVGQNLGSP